MPRSSAEMTKWQSATESYLRELEIKGASPKTVQNKAILLERFTQFMWDNGHTLSGPTFSVVQAWRDELLIGHKISTVRQYLVELRIFFAWASDPDMGEARIYASNPVSKRLIPDTRKQAQRPHTALLTDEQAMRLWRNVRPNGNKSATWPRNYAITVLLLSTDIRSAELLDLRLCDLDWANAEITVEHGKGDKYRAVDFPEIAQTAIKLYLQSGERPEGLPSTAPLFGTRYAQDGFRRSPDGEWVRGTKQWLHGLVTRHVQAVTGVAGVGPHDLRHEGARLDLNNGMSMEELQAKLGHASMKTTQIYSGRLQPGKARKGAQRVYDERDIQARRNAQMLDMLQGQMA